MRSFRKLEIVEFHERIYRIFHASQLGQRHFAVFWEKSESLQRQVLKNG